MRRKRDFSELCWTSTMVIVAAMATGGCYEGPMGGRGQAWNPDVDDGIEDDADTDGDEDDSTAEGDDDTQPEPVGDEDDTVCDPLSSQSCTCDSGLSGTQWCNPDGLAYGACQCDDSSDPDPGDSSSQPEGRVCFLGADRAGDTCFDVVEYAAPPAGYEYPGMYQGNPNYRAPVAYIDLDAVDLETYVAPNFKLGEIAQRHKGQYAIVQPHAVASLQALRDAVGAIGVNSGYRSPAYNADVGGATYSRHMYGDGFDLDPAAGLSALEAACTEHGGMLVEYSSHVHCDFRFDDVDPVLFGDEPAAAVATEPQWWAQLEEETGVFVAPATGFDEGEPMRRWAAFDADGEQIAEGLGPIFVPPPQAARVEVEVGHQVWLGRDL